MPDQDGFPLPLERDLTFRDSEAHLVPDIKLDDDSKIPWLGASRGPRALSLFGIPIVIGVGGPATRVHVSRPSLFLPRPDLLPTSTVLHTAWNIVYAPIDTPSKAFVTPGNELVGFRMPGGACYLWSKGWWWISVNSTDPGTLLFSVIPCEDPLLIDRLIALSAQNGSFELVLAAAVVNTLFGGAETLRLTHVRINNSGANPATYTFGDNEVPDANTGFLLNPGETHTYTGQEIPMGRCRMFSASGTNIHAVTVARFG